MRVRNLGICRSRVGARSIVYRVSIGGTMERRGQSRCLKGPCLLRVLERAFLVDYRQLAVHFVAVAVVDQVEVDPGSDFVAGVVGEIP
jgi:hypothetical protein